MNWEEISFLYQIARVYTELYDVQLSLFFIPSMVMCGELEWPVSLRQSLILFVVNVKIDVSNFLN